MSTTNPISGLGASTSTAKPPPVGSLILDTSPLLTQTPLRNLAEFYLTVPQVLSELKDPRSIAHFKNLSLMEGVSVRIVEPSGVAIAKVIEYAKKTGDYAALSYADICVLALVYEMDQKAKAAQAAKTPQPDMELRADGGAGETSTPLLTGTEKVPVQAQDEDDKDKVADSSEAQGPATQKIETTPDHDSERLSTGPDPDLTANNSVQPQSQSQLGDNVQGDNSRATGTTTEVGVLTLLSLFRDLISSLFSLFFYLKGRQTLAGSLAPVPQLGDGTSESSSAKEVEEACTDPDPEPGTVVAADDTDTVAAKDSDVEHLVAPEPAPANVVEPDATQPFTEGAQGPNSEENATDASSPVVDGGDEATEGSTLVADAEEIQEQVQDEEEDEDEEDDGEGEWITPDNAAIHKARAYDLDPDGFTPFTRAGRRGKKRNVAKSKGPGESQEPKRVAVGCMTGDFAMQNVILQMGLNLVGLQGKRIEKVRTTVLRCHACFKICKDPSKTFCPTCGGPTLMRATVTISSPTPSNTSGQKVQVHLKKNFQYRLRGTKYPIPPPKPGTSKTGSRTGLVLREDQEEYQRAKKLVENKRKRDETKAMRGLLNGSSSAKAAAGGAFGGASWMDPDWIPEMMRVGTGGKGRVERGPGVDKDGIPLVGYGRKNPNESRRRR